MADSNPIEYREIAGFPGYRVGSDGSVWSSWQKHQRQGRGTYATIGEAWKPMKQGRQKDRTSGRSYCLVRLSRAGQRSKCVRVHRLVLEAFVGSCPGGMETRHLDGDPTNNRRSNLCWGTPAENAQDRVKHGRRTNKARYYTHEGKTLILKDWARLRGISYVTLWNRIKNGMAFSDAISIGRYDRKAIKRSRP